MTSDQQPRQHVDTLVGRAVADVERSLHELVDGLLRAFEEERQSAVEHATSEARAAANRELAEKLADAEARHSEAEDTARREADRRVEEAIAHARTEADEALRVAEADATRRVEEALRVAEADATRRIDEARAEAESALAASMAARVEEVSREAAQTADEASASARSAQASEREASLGRLERLRDAVLALDGATSLKECLDRLADSASHLAARSFLLVVRGNTLRGWRVSGFGDAVPQPESIVLTLDGSGPLREVIDRGESREVHPEAFGEPTDKALAFARTPEGPLGVAVPVSLGGRPVAVVYADDGSEAEREVPTGWPDALEILARHTSRCLEALTAAKSVAMMAQGTGHTARGENGVAAGDPPAASSPGADPASPEAEAVNAAERYARLVVSEIKLYNEPAIRIARHRKDIRARLRAEIDRARRMYEERIAPSVPHRDEIFEQELVRVLADGQPDLLGTQAPDVA